MDLPHHKTRIVATIGPASQSPAILEQLIRAGMSIARLNFSHGDFSEYEKVIANIRDASRRVGTPVAIMADLPGPKMRIGRLAEEPIELRAGDYFTLTTEDVPGTAAHVSVSFAKLPRVVKPGNRLFLNDGIIQLEVVAVGSDDVRCKVIAGGELRSRKGLNIPGIDLGISAFTERDHTCLAFALKHGIDAVSQSFVDRASDIEAVRAAARALGGTPFIIAKIERSTALANIDEIMHAADGIMIARGDLGVEIPIERIAITQKQLTLRANLLGKPVITATQMLESMTEHRLPTRAEATDVANAIIDGTDCVMLSGESATGKYPVEAVAMLAKIAQTTEKELPRRYVREALQAFGREHPLGPHDLISLSVETILKYITPGVIVVPTRSGATARSVARFRFPVWIAAVTSDEATRAQLLFSYGVVPVLEPNLPDDWNAYTRARLAGTAVETAILIEGPSPHRPDANHRIEILDLSRSRGTG